MSSVSEQLAVKVEAFKFCFSLSFGYQEAWSQICDPCPTIYSANHWSMCFFVFSSPLTLCSYPTHALSLILFTCGSILKHLSIYLPIYYLLSLCKPLHILFFKRSCMCMCFLLFYYFFMHVFFKKSKFKVFQRPKPFKCLSLMNGLRKCGIFIHWHIIQP